MKSKPKPKDEFVLNTKSPLGKFIKDFRPGIVHPRAREFYTEYQTSKPVKRDGEYIQKNGVI